MHSLQGQDMPQNSKSSAAGGESKRLDTVDIIDWRSGQFQSMYKSWDSYLRRYSELHIGSHYCDEAIKLNPYDWKALLTRSRIKRDDARAKDAVIDSLRAKNIYKLFHPKSKNPEIDFEISDGLLESNEFEQAKMYIHCMMGRITASQVPSMQRRSHMVKSIIYDTLSEETMDEVHRLINKTLIELANKPRYVKPDCDIDSILEKEENFLSPLERKRRERVFKTFNHAYLQSSWKDITFLKQQRENPDLLLAQCVKSSEYLKSLISDKYKTIRNFTKMLHARQPMYSLNRSRFPDKELYNNNQQANLFRIQYQTRRNMFKILQTIRTLIKRHDLAKLTKFVEDITDNYVAYKTQRIMPWNFEFINEVYNFLGLALIKEYKISSNLKTLYGRTKLSTLLNIPLNIVNTSRNGSDSILNIRREKAIDYKADLYKQRIARFEARLRQAKHTIERSYLYYAAAQANLVNHSFDTCCLLAGKSINEAKKGNHHMWAVLSALVACKAHTVLGKLENQKKMLNVALKFATRLKNIDLILFVDVCLRVNSEEMDLKKSGTYAESGGKRRLHRSWSSLSTRDTSGSVSPSPYERGYERPSNQKNM